MGEEIQGDEVCGGFPSISLCGICLSFWRFSFFRLFLILGSLYVCIFQFVDGFRFLFYFCAANVFVSTIEPKNRCCFCNVEDLYIDGVCAHLTFVEFWTCSGCQHSLVSF